MSQRVALGSRNAVKIRATERACPAAEVIPIGVDADVPEQPVGHPETRHGARTRAIRALDGVKGSIAIGIEGGIGSFPPEDSPHLIMWVAVVDADSTPTMVAGPGIPLPGAIHTRIDAGETLGTIVQDRAGREASATGAIGLLTDGRVDREDPSHGPSRRPSGVIDTNSVVTRVPSRDPPRRCRRRRRRGPPDRVRDRPPP